jgi:alkylation response protein AidB-like acyl-CoA dehydrogenase
MPSYTPPLDDIRFVLNDVLKAGSLSRDIADYKEADWDTINGMLDAVAEYARDVAFPLNQSGDKEQCTYNPADKSVTTPKGFKEAYAQYVDLGLIGMSSDPRYGGMGMPQYLNVAASEMLTAANFSLSSYPGLTGGAYKALHKFASDKIKDEYLPRMLAGE